MDILVIIVLLIAALGGAWIDLLHARRALKYIYRATEIPLVEPKMVMAVIRDIAHDGLGGGPIKKGEV